jgi:hypothetical protein
MKKTPSRKSRAFAMLLSQSAKRTKSLPLSELDAPRARFPQGFPQFLWTDSAAASGSKTPGRARRP